MITLCFTYFKSLGLANLAAALYSVRRQDLMNVEEMVVVDNDTSDSVREISDVIDELEFPMPVKLISDKHGDSSRTHSWSSNLAVGVADTPWVLFTRADYILDFKALQLFTVAINEHSWDWDGFVTGNVYHLSVDIQSCEITSWRQLGPRVLRGLPGAEEDYTKIDSGVWMARKDAFNRVGGLDESLTAWGHAQTHFQHKLYEAGTEFVRIPEVLFYHPQHSAPRDLGLAHIQLSEKGIDLKKMWARHEGVKPYGS